MMDRELFDAVVLAWFGLSAIVFLVVMFISAPYGRHERGGWGPTMPARWGWVVMELPAVLVPIGVYVQHGAWQDAGCTLLLGMWLTHYLYRTFWWPLTTVATSKRMPVLVCLLALVTNLVIDWLNAEWVFSIGRPYGLSWLGDPRFVLGAALFFGGMVVNRQSDAILRGLRAPGETGYKVPHGGLYRWVSCPNYLGEIVEWLGWAVATWSLPGLAFAVWTAANLAPRARDNHKWYREKFDSYPKARKALIPGVW